MAEPQYLHIAPDRMAVTHGPDPDGEDRVRLMFEYDAKDAPWLAPDLRMLISLSPVGARELAKMLQDKADEAEARTIQ